MHPPIDPQLREVLRAIIEGSIVKRNRHELVHDGVDVAHVFIEELHRAGYLGTTVEEITVNPGERTPAFHIDGITAYFGWIFWERFTAVRMRKLWGSVLKDRLGDWQIQIPSGRPTIIYANPDIKLEMDIDHPPQF